MVASSKPTVLTQYPRDQKFLGVGCPFRWMYRCIRTALFPFKNPMVNATLYLGGTLRHICTWSGLRLPSRNSSPLCRHKSFSISPTIRLNLPYSFLFRYFGAITKWYLQSQRTCDKLCQSCIGSSSTEPFGAFPGEEPILFPAGSVEPFSVHHYKWWLNA
jgi:hypothetical protein